MRKRVTVTRERVVGLILLAALIAFIALTAGRLKW